jgi:xylulokinase
MYIGIDIGTQSVKSVLMSSDGTLLYKSSIYLSYDYYDYHDACEGDSTQVRIHEQNPHEWKEAVDIIIMKMCEKFPDAKKILKEICITGTSGTIIPVGQYGEYLFPAIMYNDERSYKEAKEINDIIKEKGYSFPVNFTSGFSLPKILWIKRNEDFVFQKTTTFCHTPDYIIGYLTNSFEISDYSSALKTGYLMSENKWAGFIEKELAIPLTKLPKVQALGLLVASLSKESMERYGFERPVAVITGCTDSTAKTIAAGLKDVGDTMISFGNTLVVRYINSQQKVDAENAYSHYHPNKLWISGSTSNVSLQRIGEKFLSQELDLDKLEEEAKAYFPTDGLVYPLECTGENFPFHDKKFAGFEIGNFETLAKRFAAHMEGTCYVARLCLQVLRGEDYHKMVRRLVVVGQNTNSDIWMQLCADVLGIEVEIPLYPEPAYGAALLAAASGTFGQDINKAIAKCVKIDKTYVPNPEKSAYYNQKFKEFVKTIEDTRSRL